MFFKFSSKPSQAKLASYIGLPFLFMSTLTFALDYPVVQMIKRNAVSFAIDGNSGSANKQDVYLSAEDQSNENQQWNEIDRGNGYYSYQKMNTNHCLHGQSGGENGQNVFLWTCLDTNQNQQWLKVDVGNGHHRLEKRNAPGYSIDGGNTGSDGQTIYLWSTDNSDQNQHWYFNYIEGGPVSAEAVIASVSDDGSGHANYPVENVIDGDTSFASRWAANGSPATLMIQLEELAALNEVSVAWGRGDANTYTFEVYARASASETWTHVFAGVSSGSTEELESYDVSDINALQVQIRSYGTTAGSEWTNITEVAVNGSGDDSDDTNTEPEWMSYMEGHLEKISPYSWGTPQRWVHIRKNGDYTDEEIDIIANASMILQLQTDEVEQFREKYPNRLYHTGYLNLERDYGSRNLESGHFLTNPEHYLYNSDGSVFLGGNDPYFNLAVPGMRDWWIAEVDRQVSEAPFAGDFFVDALVKAYDVGGSSKVDYWGIPVADGYREEAIKPLLAQWRDEFAHRTLLKGNFLRVNRPNGLKEYCLDYLHSCYIEGFERVGNYAENANQGIKYIQEVAAAGKMVQLTVGAHVIPPMIPEMTLEQNREKAQLAMPEFWAEIDEAERDELAEIYANFDFKLAMFLIAAGEHSYFKYSVSPLANSAGTKLFKNIQPFPEWNMPLGQPLEDGQQDGNRWTRRFTHVEVVLDMDEGYAEFLPPGTLPVN